MFGSYSSLRANRAARLPSPIVNVSYVNPFKRRSDDITGHGMDD